MAEIVALDFSILKDAVSKQFAMMSKSQLFRVNVDKDELWHTYLSSFPEGTNPIYKTKSEHDCGCCRQFIRNIGDVVSIVDGKLVSIWDLEIDGPYGVVASKLSSLVKSCKIENLYLHTENSVGTDKNFQDLMGQVKTWKHFYVNLPSQAVAKGKDIGPSLSDSRATHDVMLRSLTEITNDAVETVLELISQGSLYRGEEQKYAVTEFQKLKRQFNKLKTDKEKDLFVWDNVKKLNHSVARIRNTAIGTLLQNLSEDMDIETAVKAWETVMAPTNYKRPTALITKKMIEEAGEKIKNLGLMSALERRFARLTDISPVNVLHANMDSKAVIAGSVFDDLVASLPTKAKNYDKVEEMDIEKFVKDVLPNAKEVELLFENRHVGNLVSLISPVDPTAGNLFKWNNNFSWTYNGDVADSVKERVKRAGGNVTGDLCCRLAWYNYDDLDLWMIEPDGFRICYSSKRSNKGGGQLDVDMNPGGGSPGRGSREAVENIFYPSRSCMKEGTYKLGVNNYRQVEKVDIGFEVEIDYLGDSKRFVYDKEVRTGENVVVAEFTYSRDKGIEIKRSLPSSESSKQIWNLQTQNFHKVNVISTSPNHWEEPGIGNKHYMFFIEGCQNDGTARGFYNEFLKSELEPHRKAFEVVGSKMRATETNDQLSGLGFTKTPNKNHVILRVKGSFTRTLKVIF